LIQIFLNDIFIKVQPLDFPKYIANITDSLSYTKKLVVTAISSILYLRGLFSEKYFVDRKFEDMTFKIIKPPSKNLCETGIIAQWLHGSFDALDKKYLKCISLSFYENPDDNKNVLETYEFGISYNGENVELTLNTTDAKKAAKKAKMNAFRLLRTIIFTSGTLVDLPVKICVTMRLFYYEDVTPVEYEPNGFESSDFEKYTFQNGHIRIDGNKASTQWHEATFNINVDNSMIKQMNDLEKINETFDHGR
jgi:meiosis-specific protein HOP1